jgi:hypothetical protein
MHQCKRRKNAAAPRPSWVPRSGFSGLGDLSVGTGMVLALFEPLTAAVHLESRNWRRENGPDASGGRFDITSLRDGEAKSLPEKARPFSSSWRLTSHPSLTCVRGHPLAWAPEEQAAKLAVNLKSLKVA